MANCIIHPIPLYYHDKELPHMPPRSDGSRLYTLVDYVWYIEGTKEKILVDADGDANYMDIIGEPVNVIQTLDAGLEKLGLGFNDIDLVILTHLHFDHTAQAHRFTKARFLVQKKELDFAQNPHPSAAGAYNKEFYNGLNFDIVDGDVQVCEGVSVLSTPGHTPGGQSVSIDTANGVVIIAGLCTTQENFKPSPVDNTMLVTIGKALNLIQAYDSLLQIKNVADIVLPIHDPTFMHVSSVP